MKLSKLLLISVLILFPGCSSQEELSVQQKEIVSTEAKEALESQSNYVNIKYRTDTVDIGAKYFESLNTSKSSFIRGAWYDSGNKYMVINLNGTYYHYCGLPSNTWSSFKVANSFGTYYNKSIKGSYDCRVNFVPNY